MVCSVLNLNLGPICLTQPHWQPKLLLLCSTTTIVHSSSLRSHGDRRVQVYLQTYTTTMSWALVSNLLLRCSTFKFLLLLTPSTFRILDSLLWMIYWTTKVKWVDNVISILPAAQEIQQPVPGRSQASPTSTGARLMCFVLQDRSPNVPEHPIHSIGKPSLSSSNSYFTERNGHYSLRRSRPITMQIYGLGSECTQ